jgi:hypothetical protein
MDALNAPYVLEKWNNEDLIQGKMLMCCYQACSGRNIPVMLKCHKIDG